MATWTIYCHVHIDSGRRYVGQTRLSMMKRWNRHVYNAVKRGERTYFANAIRKYGKEAFSHEVLEAFQTVAEANVAEEKWIAFYDTRNPERGFNLTKGGGHAPHPIKNPWEREGFREKVSASMKDWFKDPENAALQSARSKESQSRPEVRKKQSESTVRQFADPAARKAMSDKLKELHQDPEIAAKFRKGLETADRNKRERTHCKKLHEFSQENTYFDAKGWRHCRRCLADRAVERNQGRSTCRKGHDLTGDNVRIGASGQRICVACLPTTCRKGHPMTPDNVSMSGQDRLCRICRNERGRVHDAERRKRRRMSSCNVLS